MVKVPDLYDRRRRGQKRAHRQHPEPQEAGLHGNGHEPVGPQGQTLREVPVKPTWLDLLF